MFCLACGIFPGHPAPVREGVPLFHTAGGGIPGAPLLLSAQRRPVEEVVDDTASPARSMNRLVQGDVGSGKTMAAYGAWLAARTAASGP